MSAPILVTGAGGDIGTAIVRRLIADGLVVLATALDGERQRIAALGVDFIDADLPAPSPPTARPNSIPTTLPASWTSMSACPSS